MRKGARHGAGCFFAASIDGPHSVALQTDIDRYRAERNANPKPFVWTASPSGILAELS